MQAGCLELLRSPLLEQVECLQQEVAIHRREHVEAVELAVTYGVQASLFRVSEQRGEVLAVKTLGDGRFLFRAGIGHGDQGRHNVEVGRHRPAVLATGECRVRHDQRHVVLLAVGAGALAGQLVRAAEFAVVRGQNDDGVGSEAAILQLIEHRHDVAVDVAQRVEIEVVPLAPAPCILDRDRAGQCVVRQGEVGVCGGASGRVDRLRETGRQLEVPLPGVNLVRRIADDGVQRFFRLHRMSRLIRIVKHHVVRVDQVHREEPGFVLLREIGRLAAQPACRGGSDHAVVQVAALGMRDDVADPEVIGKAVGFHLLGEDFRRRGKRVVGLEFPGEVPLALVGGVVPGFAQLVSDRLDVGRHALYPGEVRVVEHPGLLDMATGIDHCARGRAHAGVDAVVLEHHAALRQPLVGRQAVVLGKFIRVEMALLVRHDEHNVVGAAGRLIDFFHGFCCSDKSHKGERMVAGTHA